MTLLLVVVALTLLISALCSLFEATLYSTRVVTLEAARDEGRHRASAVQFIRLKRNIGGPTSAVLILNTISNTAGATFAGMLAASALGSDYILIFSVILTLSILLFSEILPKTYGATHWKGLWPTVVWPLVALEKLLRPLIWLTQTFAGLFIKKQAAPVTTEQEIVAMIRSGARAGQLSSTEHELLTAVFRFDESTARDVMFPRREAVCFDISWDLKRCLDEANLTHHTRYPLIDGSLDNVLGMVHIKDLLAVATDDSADIGALARPLHRVPESMPARVLLREMQTQRPHMVAVIDEHATVMGLATLENLLELLVGAVQDEFDDETPEMVRESDGIYVVQGSTSIARLNVELALDIAAGLATSVSGLVVAELGRNPKQGDRIELGNATIEVLVVKSDRASSVRLRIDPMSDVLDAG